MKKTFAISLIALALTVPAVAGSLESAGDGSYTDNPDLLREAVDGMDGACSDCDPGPSVIEFDDHFFDFDWSLALRGGFVQDSVSGSYWEASAIPSFELSRESSRSRLSLSGSAELVRSEIAPARLASLRLAVAGDYRLDQLTILGLDASVTLARPASNAPGNAANVIESSQTLDGGISGTVQHQFGAFDVEVRGNLQRTINGPTTTTGGVVIDNSWQDSTSGGGGLRLTMDVSPTFSLFTDLSAAYARYNGVSPTLGVSFNGPTYTAKAGIKATWRSLLEAEGSVGVGLRRYDTAGLADFQALLYDGRLVFTPDETWTFTTTLSTTMQPPGTSGGNGRVVYAVGADARYTVNPWLALRASASWTRTAVVGTGAIETVYTLGAGADYAVNDSVTVNADYSFSRADTPPRDIHRWMLGLTFAK